MKGFALARTCFETEANTGPKHHSSPVQSDRLKPGASQLGKMAESEWENEKAVKWDEAK